MTDSPEAAQTSRKRRWKIPVLVIAVLVVIGAGGIYWLFGGDPPAEVDIEATASAVAGEADDDSEEPAIASEGVDGEWAVDLTIGEFSITEEATSTFVGFRVDEELSLGETTAVGRSPDVSGSIVIEGNTLQSADITVDLTAIVSDQSRRDNSIQEALGTEANPEATFTLTEAIDLDPAAADGATVSAPATGELTINGVTNEVVVALDAQLVDGSILVTGSTEVLFEDYGVSAPTAPMVVSVEDHAIVEFQLWLSR